MFLRNHSSDNSFALCAREPTGGLHRSKKKFNLTAASIIVRETSKLPPLVHTQSPTLFALVNGVDMRSRDEDMARGTFRHVKRALEQLVSLSRQHEVSFFLFEKVTFSPPSLSNLSLESDERQGDRDVFSFQWQQQLLPPLPLRLQQQRP